LWRSVLPHARHFLIGCLDDHVLIGIAYATVPPHAPARRHTLTLRAPPHRTPLRLHARYYPPFRLIAHLSRDPDATALQRVARTTRASSALLQVDIEPRHPSHIGVTISLPPAVSASLLEITCSHD